MGDLALIRAMQEATPEERKAALLLMKHADYPEEVEAVALLLESGRRRRQRRNSDAKTDHERRLLVGPRLPREIAEQYRAAAEARHLSLYSWAAQALAAQYRRELPPE